MIIVLLDSYSNIELLVNTWDITILKTEKK